MADYFTEYSSFAKGLPSPADTPYETPDFIRSKRSSRVAVSREQSVSPPLPPDTAESRERSRDGRLSGVDPRRFTPTLHASLVSEILNLRRELDSKNNLVENLETSLSSAQAENETLEAQLSESNKDVRKAKQQVQQMEKGVYDAVEDLVTERDAAAAALEELKNKFEQAQKRARYQDEDALRTQSIWEAEKESWDNERRQLERRVHITETRLRVVVDEIAASQVNAMHVDEHSDETTFKDSGLGEGSDTASIRSASPTKHKRSTSGISHRARHIRSSVASRRTAATPDLYARPGNSLADELGIDEEDEYDMDDSDHPEEDLDIADSTQTPTTDSRLDSMTTESNGKLETSIESPEPVTGTSGHAVIVPSLAKEAHYEDGAQTRPTDITPPKPSTHAVYVDTGYQPSPPPSPAKTAPAEKTLEDGIRAVPDEAAALPETNVDHAVPESHQKSKLKGTSSPMSPPQTPVIGEDDEAWSGERAIPVLARSYSTASTQTDLVEPEQRKGHGANRDSLSPPAFVPAIAIHPPTSRPSSPRPYVLPPGTKNASAQASLGWPCRDASMQTEEIRVDRRSVKLPPHLLPNSLLPSPAFQESARSKRGLPGNIAKILTKSSEPSASAATPAISASPPLQSPINSSPAMSRNNSSKDLRNYPLKAIPLPRPILSPVSGVDSFPSNGPLNRSAQYGVTRPRTGSSPLADADNYSDVSDREDVNSEFEFVDNAETGTTLIRPPPGRFGLSEPPKAVPEDKEISPERRPETSDSRVAAPAPSISSSRAPSQNRHVRQPAGKPSHPDARRDIRSRSPSFGSYASSSRSVQSSFLPMPPYPIPLRSSSRVPPKSYSEGSQSPTPREVFGARNSRSGRSQYDRQLSLRKVQSAAVIRNRTGRGSPTKHRRRRRSPNLTPVQSMAFDSPAPTDFPIPDLPTPLQDSQNFNYMNGPLDHSESPRAGSTQARPSEETNLVDAIAATMVGEWMWKYIRKRKSFGIAEDSAEFPVAGQNGVVSNVTAHGTRHKRWVWLSPYERTIMWDNKQPTSGPALLGKKGRKLAIQSVIEVDDSTPLPKSPELPSAWMRSILILTPERALKFTTINQERHHLWLTALYFLAQSEQLPTQIPQRTHLTPTLPIPPIPPLPSTSIDGVPIKRRRAPSFGKARVRDSIRLTQAQRPDLQKTFAETQQPYGPDLQVDHGDPDEGADFPAVPRLYVSTSRHQRKRSNTSPRLPPTLANLRSFSSSAAVSSTSASSSHHHAGSGNGSVFRPSASSKSGSWRESVASPVSPNFFEAFGTVRMEAFVDPNVRDGVLYVPAPPPGIGSTQRRARHGSNLSQNTVDKRRAGYVFDEDGMDPFKGF